MQLLLLLTALAMSHASIRRAMGSDEEGGTIFPDADEFDLLPDGPNEDETENEDARAFRGGVRAGFHDKGRSTLPSAFTYRNHKCLTLIDQGSCGCCFAASATMLLSFRRCLMYNDTNVISLEDDINCDREQYLNVKNNGCHGGSPLGVFKYGNTVGNVYESCLTYKKRYYPYPTEKCTEKCDDGSTKKRFTSNKGPYRLSGEEKIMRDIYENGPIAVSFYLANDFPPKKVGDVYQQSSSTKLGGGHSAMIIGWGTQNGVPYWDCANTYGPNWHDHGFFRIRRGKNDLSIERYPCAALPTSTGIATPTTSPGTFNVTKDTVIIAGHPITLKYENITYPTDLVLKADTGSSQAKDVVLGRLTTKTGSIQVTLPKTTAPGTYTLSTADGATRSVSFTVFEHFALAFNPATYTVKMGASASASAPIVKLKFGQAYPISTRLSLNDKSLATLSKNTASYDLSASVLKAGDNALKLVTVGALPELSATATVTLIQEKEEEKNTTHSISFQKPTKDDVVAPGGKLSVRLAVVGVSKVILTLISDCNGKEFGLKTLATSKDATYEDSVTLPTTLPECLYTLRAASSDGLVTAYSDSFNVKVEKKDDNTVEVIEPSKSITVKTLVDTVRLQYRSTRQAPMLVQGYCGKQLLGILAAGLPNTGSVDLRLPSQYQSCENFFFRVRTEAIPFSYGDSVSLRVQAQTYTVDSLPAPLEKPVNGDDPLPEPVPDPTPDDKPVQPPEPMPEPIPEPPVPIQPNTELQITSPDTKSVWVPGTKVTIKWATILPRTETMTLLLYQKSGKSTQLRATFSREAPNTGEYQTTLPNTLPAGTYFLRVRSSSMVSVETGDFTVRSTKLKASFDGFEPNTNVTFGSPLQFNLRLRLTGGLSLFPKRPRLISAMLLDDESEAMVCHLKYHTEGATVTVYPTDCPVRIGATYRIRLCTPHGCVDTPSFRLTAPL
ncbi:Cathepsin B-like cysteine proteinase [Giardia muris]|uniref:Cathepsin B-like cysteine proteinase n=1 Tax=Giardia muris TaxID=5742 RepID=A0A4Z1SLN7_GIAMU|nr:Cathepsin B-like cysteine proteinase [Giardia muris]|eukprot:TNJ26572.1 Cathepsin B-like cysteine proteinase [Giardia muris]